MKNGKFKKRRMIGIDDKLGDQLRMYAEKKYGYLRGSVKSVAEEAIKNHISGV